MRGHKITNRARSVRLRTRDSRYGIKSIHSKTALTNHHGAEKEKMKDRRSFPNEAIAFLFTLNLYLYTAKYEFDSRSPAYLLRLGFDFFVVGPEGWVFLFPFLILEFEFVGVWELTDGPGCGLSSPNFRARVSASASIQVGVIAFG